MTRTVFPFVAKDVSALARSLARELEAIDRRPSHLELLNMLARAAGYRNFQHFRAQHEAQDRLEAGPAAPEPVDHRKLEKLLRYFDDHGRLAAWPSKTGHQRLCLWVLWSRIPRDVVMTEREVSAVLKTLNGFGDHAILRRELVETGLLSRTDDCREYRRLEQAPPAEAAALIRLVGRQNVAGGGGDRLGPYAA